MSERSNALKGATVSVIVSCYNEEATLYECLTSLLNQTYASDSYEILHVDNGSSDRSVEIASRFNRICLIQESKPGVYSTRNTAIKYSKGSILVFTDADCQAD